jgi:hypothetical protein
MNAVSIIEEVVLAAHRDTLLPELVSRENWKKDVEKVVKENADGNYN